MVVGEIVEKRNIVIIGGGPGGYNAAIRAAQLGLTVTLIEKNQLGGVCLNQGCIPSKIFAYAAKEFASISGFSELGIAISEATFSIHQLSKHKEKIIRQLRVGVEALCKSNRIEIIVGEANFTGKNKIGVERGAQFDVYEFNQAIIATGSTTVLPTYLRIDDPRILLPYNIYQIEEIPEQLIVYGSDYISLEVAFSFKKLGTKDVTIIVKEKDFPFDNSINRELKRILKKEKIKVHFERKINNIIPSQENIKVVFHKKNQEEIVISGTHLFASGKQQAAIESLGIERFGVDITENGYIKTDETMKTSINNIFAVGDVTEGPSLAVKAIKQGKVAAETIAEMKSEVDLTFLPTVVHSIPPISTVGLTEQEAKEHGYKVKTSQYSLSGNAFAMISDNRNGVVKIIKDAESDLLLGFHAIGQGAIELISTGITALELVAREEDLNFPMYPHPSMNEAIMEAIENLSERSIHMAPANRKGSR